MDCARAFMEREKARVLSAAPMVWSRRALIIVLRRLRRGAEAGLSFPAGFWGAVDG